MGHQSYVLLCTETTLSKHPVVHPKSSCGVHLLRSLCTNTYLHTLYFSVSLVMEFIQWRVKISSIFGLKSIYLTTQIIGFFMKAIFQGDTNTYIHYSGVSLVIEFLQCTEVENGHFLSGGGLTSPC